MANNPKTTLDTPLLPPSPHSPSPHSPYEDSKWGEFLQCCCPNVTEALNGTRPEDVGFNASMWQSLLLGVNMPHYNTSLLDSGDIYTNMTSSLSSPGGANYSSALDCDMFLCANTTCPTPSATGEGNPFIQPWYIQCIYYFFFVAMVLVATGGNLIVIWIVLAHKRMRTVTNFFLVNLAIADALISVLNTLFNFVYMLYSDWPFGSHYCKFLQFISPCAICASVFTFVAIAVDRYMAIIHPLKPRMRAGTVLGVIGIIWLAATVVAFPCILFGNTFTWKFASGSTRTICYLAWPDGMYSTTNFGYAIFIMLVNYFVPLSVLAITYACVGVELWGSQAIGEVTAVQEESIRSKRRVVKMMVVVVTIFAICWLPQHVFFLVSNQHQHINDYPQIQHIYLIIYWIAMSNSMYNPIIYCWMNARFRKGFKYVFRWLPCVHWRPSDSLCRPPPSTSVRISMSDGTRFERNGSMMHTMIESLEESSYYPPSSLSHGVHHPHYRGYVQARINDHQTYKKENAL